MIYTLVDTSVLCELIEVPGMHSRSAEIRADLDRRQAAGEQFVIPVTAIIETGNHIEHAAGDRRGAAQRLVGLVRMAIANEGPWRVNNFRWDAEFLGAWCDGDSTHQSFVDLAGNHLLGGGDVAILVERDRFRSAGAGNQVSVWTLDARLEALA